MKPLIIFDCDGTLVDSEGLANGYFVELVNDMGVPLTLEEAWQHFPGTSLRLCMEYVEKRFDFAFPDDFVPRYREGQKEVFSTHLQPIKGIEECLDILHDHPICVASNGPREIIEANLHTTGLREYFGSHIYSAYELQHWKPDPKLFLHAADKFGYDPRECLVIEDSMAGIEAGLNAGMKVFGYNAHGHSGLPDRDEITYFQDMKVLPELIQKLTP